MTTDDVRLAGAGAWSPPGLQNIDPSSRPQPLARGVTLGLLVSDWSLVTRTASDWRTGPGSS